MAIASAQTAPSTAPAAPSMWPVIDFVEDTATRCAISSPSTALIATVSLASFNCVEVPCAFTYWTDAGSPASSSAHRIARAAPDPLGSGAVMWCASSDIP